MKRDYYSGGNAVFKIKKARAEPIKPGEDRFRLYLSLIHYDSRGAVDGITYPTLVFTFDDWAPNEIFSFDFAKEKTLRVVDWFECDEEERKKYFFVPPGEKEPGETLRNYIYGDGELKAVIDGPFKYFGAHSLGEDERTVLSESFDDEPNGNDD